MVVAMFQCYSLNLSLPLLQLSSQVLPLHLCIYSVQFSSFQWLSRVWLLTTAWTPARQASLSITNSRVYRNSCALSRWYHLTISSSVIPFSSSVILFSSCLQSFPTSGSVQVSQLFTSCGQNIGVSASTSVLPMNTQDWFPLGWTGWISCSPRNSQESFPTPQFKSINSLLSCFYSLTLTSYMTTRKIIALTRQTFVNKIMSLLFHMLSRLVITFLPRSKHLLISCLQSPSARKDRSIWMQSSKE